MTEKNNCGCGFLILVVNGPGNFSLDKKIGDKT
jgi:uncharacterized membrane protein YphA (DoxX/SURF4 family)